MQSQLSAALRQKERHAQLGQAVAKISHDLRNMLTTIQMLSDTLSLSKDPSVNRLTPKLVKNVERAVALTEGALTFGKAEEPAPQPEYIDLNVLVDEVIENEQKFINGRDIAIEKEITVSEKIFADPDQLYRVLGNLVRNALQAIIDTGEIKILARDLASGWQIDIRDTGPGLSQKAQDHLFEAFQGRARSGGTGLGLVISQDIIKGHGGSLRLHETSEKGTVFRILLPNASSPN